MATGKANTKDTGEGRRDIEEEEAEEGEGEEGEGEECMAEAEGDGEEITGTRGAEEEEGISRADGEGIGSQR